MRTVPAFVLVALLALPALSHEDVTDFTLSDAEGKGWTLSEQKAVVVLVWLGVECPMANRYGPRLADLARKHPDVRFAGVNSNALEGRDAIAAHAKEQGLPFRVLIDAGAKLADTLKVTTTPTAVVIDKDLKVRYRGRIDDHKSEDLVKKRWLREAIEALAAGIEPYVTETEAVGCAIRRAEVERDAGVTYASHVATILNQRCVSCHRANQVAPFSLEGYTQARRWARESARHAKLGTMPPWKPSNVDLFRDERRLTKDEIDTLAKWAEAGAPRGDASKEPQPPKFPEGWMLGEPDAVLEAQEFELAAEGPDEYRCFVLPTDFEDDRWVQGVEVRPGNFRVVHHVIAYVDNGGTAEKLDERDPAPGYKSSGTGPGFAPSGEMGGWAPGNFPYALPEGIGRRLRKGSRIVLEVHYHRNGRKEKDRTRIGLHFSKAPVRQRLRWLTIANLGFSLKAGKERQRVFARSTISTDVTARYVMPHMHLLGREAKMTATLPDGTEKVLVHIPDWDFNWQDTYHFKEPVKLPKGTKILYEAWYDNSSKNPNQPRAEPRNVGWGEETTDEMCIAFIGYTRDSENFGEAEQE